MKKTTLTFISAGLLFVTGLKAQSISEGMNHLYAQRYMSAINIFEKLLAVNPNNIEATYWLGQGYLDRDEIMSSRIARATQLYEKAMQTTNGAPLIQVGLGHAELLGNKMDAARQHFETALTLSRSTKKGDDPVIETAIGRAIADSKSGDFKWAIRLLDDAASKDPKNTETLLQLGNAHRKAGEGHGGGPAFQAYKKALEVNSAFSVANYRIAKIFESQKNWEPFLHYLKEAVAKDSKFTPAYYEMFYYYWFNKQDYPEAEKQLNKYIESKLPETDVQDQFLYGQLCWARKDYACAVTKAEAVVMGMGDKTNPKIYRLLADANYQKGDYASAKKYSDLFFQKKNPDDYITFDHELRAKVLGKTGGTPDEIFDNYVQGAQLDTVLSNRIDFLKQGAAYFKENKIWDKFGLIVQKIIDLKPKPTINEYFDLMKSFYDNDKNSQSRDVAIIMREKFSDQVFGYDWAFKNSSIIDTVKRDSIAVPDALKLFDFAQKDSVKFRTHYINTARFLAGFYWNTAKDKEKSLSFFQKWHDIDTANAVTIQGYIDQIKKMPSVPPGKTPNPSNPKGTAPAKTSTGNLPKPSSATKSKTTTTKKAVVKN
jgi:Tfp pilus assembly protein PilF